MNFWKKPEPTKVHYILKLIFIDIFICLSCILGATCVNAGDEPVASNRVIHIGQLANTMSGVDWKDANVALGVMMERMLKKNYPNFNSSSVIFPDLESSLHRIKSGEIDLLTISSIDYLQVCQQTYMEPAIVPGTEEEATDTYLLLVDKNRQFKTLSQLKGKTVAIEKSGSGNIALMWLDTLLLESSLPESQMFLQGIRRVEKISGAVLPVFFGQADACIVRRRSYETIIELNPQVNRTLMTWFESPDFLVFLMCMRPNVDADIKKAVMEFPEIVTVTPEGKQILTIFHTKSLTRYKPEYIKNIRALYDNHTKLKSRSENK